MNNTDNIGDDLFAMRLYYAAEFTALSADEHLPNSLDELRD